MSVLSPPPGHIGPYRILRVLGEGGMGVVYEADQQEPIARRVAIKVVRADTASREVLARFDAERQALAVMTHEAIAKVLDAGTSEAGHPYFVMELVRGAPITDYCDAHTLSTRDRIALFVTVCRAVQHAHQKGVIHRDLKPSNVLVTAVDGVAVPKVIDFGIAKAVARAPTDQTLTAFGHAMGTPAYMSPEQADAAAPDVDTRSDVYSLGVMLYELLVGRLPLDPRDLGVPAFLVRLASRATEPPTPSAKLDTLAPERQTLASLRRTDPDALRRQLRGDLDWIVMRAMDPDRNRRYDTANGLAADLARFLADEPVEARAPTPGYRLQKFVRRHRAGVAAAVVVALVIVAGGVATTTGFVRARRAEAHAREEAATAEQVSRFLTGLFRVSDPNRARGNTLTARALLDSGAARVETELAAQPLVQARLMQTIGDVYAALGLYPEAERLLDRSLATRTRLLGPAAPETGATLGALGRLYSSQGRYAAAESALTRAAALTAAAEPRTAAVALDALAHAHQQQGHYAISDSVARRAIAAFERATGPASPEVAGVLTYLAISQAEQGRPVAAESLFRRVLSVRRQAFGPDHPLVAKAALNLAGSLFEQGKIAAADTLYRQALAIDRAIYGPMHPTVATDLYNVANVDAARGAHATAIARYDSARRIWETAFGPDHPNVANALTSTANTYGMAGRYAEAVPLLARALAIHQRALSPTHPFVATSEHELGAALLQLKRYPEADLHLRRALEIRRRVLDPSSYYTALTLGELGDLARARGDTAGAEREYADALAIWRASGRTGDDARTALARHYADLLRARGRGADADGVLAAERVRR